MKNQTLSHVADGVTNSKASWTPGPWQSSVPPSSCLTIRNVETENGIIIAKIGHKDSSMGHIAEHVANARLIAAAPELLEACRCALNQLDAAKPLSGCHVSSLKADIQIIRDAIAKAAAPTSA